MKSVILIVLTALASTSAFANPFEVFRGKYSVVDIAGSCGWLGSAQLSQVEFIKSATGMKVTLTEKFGNMGTYPLTEYKWRHNPDFSNPDVGEDAWMEKTSSGGAMRVVDYYDKSQQRQDITAFAAENSTSGGIVIKLSLYKSVRGSIVSDCEYSANLIKQ